MFFQILHLAPLFLCFLFISEGHIPSGGEYRDIPNSFFDSKREVPRVKSFQRNDGSYRYGFKLSDQRREETKTPDGEVSGSYGFVDPAGTEHELQYRAGRQGFLAQGTSLPKAPSYTPEVLEARKKFLSYFNQMKSFLKSMRGADDEDSESDSHSDSESEEEEHADSDKSIGEEYNSSEEDENEGGEESEEEEAEGEEHEGEEHEGEENEGEEDEGEEHEGEEHEGTEHEGEEHEGEEHQGEEHQGEEHQGEEHQGEEHQREEHEEKKEGNEHEEAVVKLKGNFFEEAHIERKTTVYNKNKRNTESVKEETLSESAKLRNIARKESKINEGDKDHNKDKIKETVINQEKRDSTSHTTEPKDTLKKVEEVNREAEKIEQKEILKEKLNKGRLEEVKKESKRDISSVSTFQNWIETPQKRRLPRLIKLVRKFISSRS